MATYTQTVHKPFVRPSRTYDYLYDPNFTVSSEQDHAKQAFKAHTSIDRIRYVPQFQTMFSVLRHYPRQGVTLDSTDPVPRHVPRMWRGYSERHRHSLMLYKKFNYAPDLQIPPKPYERPEAGGRNRYKYFRRPIIPFLPQMPPNVLLAPTKVDPTAAPGMGVAGSNQGGGGGVSVGGGEGVMGGATRSVGVQTDYRDSETQTDPYSPGYLVRPGSQPELLTLASLCHGQGLPAGLIQVEMIERAREKRRWEEGLPPLDDPNQVERRRSMMEEQERKEWEHRENEIKLLQDERMAVIKNMLKQREADNLTLNERRLENLWSKHRSEGERKLRRLRANHVKSLRQLSGKADRVTRQKNGRNIIQDYTSFDSEVYAPMTRTGVFLDAGSERNAVHSQLTTTLDGLLTLEASLPAFITQPRARAPQRGEKASGLAARQKTKLGWILDQVHNDIITERETGHEPPKPLRLLQKVEKPAPRPVTPTCSAPEPGVEEREQAIILLQRVLRGRSRQAKLYAGKEQRADLIRELRTTHALQSPEQNQKRKEKEDVLSKQTHKSAADHCEAVVSDAMEEGAAHCLGQQLDFLQKELERLQEERHVHAFLLLAERQRRMREAEESGLRQREERMRRIHDELFKQTVHVHSGTVDSYLEEVILNSIESTSDQQARLEVRRQADTINTIAHQFIHTEVSGKELAAELVYSFLLPEVEKQSTREKVHRDQRRHLLAAHRIIHSSIHDCIPPEPTESTTSKPQSTTEGTTDKPTATSEGATITPLATMMSTEDTVSKPTPTTEATEDTTSIPTATTEDTTSKSTATTEDTTSIPTATTEDTTSKSTATTEDTTSIPTATTEDTTSKSTATTEDTTSKPTVTTEDTTSIPTTTTEDTTSIPTATTEDTSSIPTATTEDTSSIPTATTEDTSSIPTTTTEDTTSKPTATTEDTTSKPTATTEDTTSKPTATTEDTSNIPTATTEDTTSKPTATTEDTSSIPTATTEDTTSKPTATTEDTTSKPTATTEDTTSKPTATAEDTSNIPTATTEDTTSKPTATTEDTSSIPTATTEDTSSIPTATTEDTTSKPMTTDTTATTEATADIAETTEDIASKPTTTPEATEEPPANH